MDEAAQVSGNIPASSMDMQGCLLVEHHSRISMLETQLNQLSLSANTPVSAHNICAPMPYDGNPTNCWGFCLKVHYI